MNWTKFKETKPQEHGYYYTFYFNETYEKYYYKAIWWDGIGWVNWKPNQDRYIKYVDKFVEESRNDYYVPCMMWAEEKSKEANAQS